LGVFGGCLDPHACFLLERSLKTLYVRVKYQHQSALEIAKFLEKHPNIENVNHPGLESSPYYQRAVQLFSGFTGIFCFRLKVKPGQKEHEVVLKFFSHLKVVTVASSLGGAETLAIQPTKTSHKELKPEECAKLGITDRLIRISVGLESTQDLIADLKRALDNLYD